MAELTALYTDPGNGAVDITRKQYVVQGADGEKRHSVGLTMNKDGQSDLSGLNMGNGEVLSVKLKGASNVDRCYVTMSYDVVLNITGETTEVLS